jgi:DNA-binding response OmpR family regulator
MNDEQSTGCGRFQNNSDDPGQDIEGTWVRGLRGGQRKRSSESDRSEKTAVNLVLADWNMPEMNGLELLKRLRQNPELASLKVIMVTTETEMDHMVSAWRRAPTSTS